MVLCLLNGCQQKMADQPSLKPLDPAVYGQAAGSAREPVAGTVARGHLHTDWALFTGRSKAARAPTVMGANETTSESNKLEPEGPRSATPEAPIPGAAPGASTNPTTPGGSSTTSPPAARQARGAQAVLTAELASYKDVVDEFPTPVTEQMVEHGRDRFMIYCVVCHDAAGTGHGKIVERGYTQPPSYHVERLRNAPVGHFFRVITLGYGSMPSYASQVPPRDRWAIISYIRAMQLSQHYPEADEDKLPKDVRDRLSAASAPAAKTPASGGGGP
ncbi:MAG TPA: cytochrome c [Pirellulales bacterium]|nr:cytochrome c [Pirellulales bacterium]